MGGGGGGEVKIILFRRVKIKYMTLSKIKTATYSIIPESQNKIHDIKQNQNGNVHETSEFIEADKTMILNFLLPH